MPTGDPAAVVFIAGKPVDVFSDIEIVGNLKFVPIPWDDRIKNWLTPWFRPAYLGSDDYPRLVPPATSVPTVASAVYLVTVALPPGSPREQGVSAMTVSFLQNLNTLQNMTDSAKRAVPAEMARSKRAGAPAEPQSRGRGDLLVQRHESRGPIG